MAVSPPAPAIPERRSFLGSAATRCCCPVRVALVASGSKLVFRGDEQNFSGREGETVTYCCGILVRDGLVMIADTRTNAGLDNVSTFRKLHLFEAPGERVMMLATSGNLSVTQGVLNLISDGLADPATGEPERLMETPTMLQAAQLIGRAVRQSREVAGDAAEQSGVSFDVALLFGGQIRGGALRLFMIYTAGNFIECTQDAPYLQIGEHKYGKPILDRAVSFETDIYDALKIGLISMDSTMRSNISVGLPIDVALLRRDALKTEVATRIDGSDAYFRDLRERWSQALKAAHIAIPPPPYGGLRS
jgi:putative proteasome-type protease